MKLKYSPAQYSPAHWLRLAALTLVLGGGLVAMQPSAAEAHLFNRGQNQRWCANTVFDGMRDCAYFTWEQCQATVSGMLGYCSENLSAKTYYDGERRGRRNKHKRHYRYY